MDKEQCLNVPIKIFKCRCRTVKQVSAKNATEREEIKELFAKSSASAVRTYIGYIIFSLI